MVIKQRGTFKKNISLYFHYVLILYSVKLIPFFHKTQLHSPGNSCGVWLQPVTAYPPYLSSFPSTPPLPHPLRSHSSSSGRSLPPGFQAALHFSSLRLFRSPVAHSPALLLRQTPCFQLGLPLTTSARLRPAKRRCRLSPAHEFCLCTSRFSSRRSLRGVYGPLLHWERLPFPLARLRVSRREKQPISVSATGVCSPAGSSILRLSSSSCSTLLPGPPALLHALLF